MFAGSLSYTTLLSIVPTVAVIFSLLSSFPVFKTMLMKIETFIFSNFMPASGEVIQEHMLGFVENASKMTSFGLAALIVVALMLIYSIDKVLNSIWQTNKARKVIVSFAIYWTVLTLGPILMGVSLTVTSYVISLAKFSNGALVELHSRALSALPFGASVLTFLMLYMLVPNKSVRFSHALCGAVTAAILFEIFKKVFALYITHFPTYKAIYGAIAALPILFIWVYLSWVVILFGAEIAACMDSFNASEET
jgi:membrane protein